MKSMLENIPRYARYEILTRVEALARARYFRSQARLYAKPGLASDNFFARECYIAARYYVRCARDALA
jgi:hypothetical protein